MRRPTCGDGGRETARLRDLPCVTARSVSPALESPALESPALALDVGGTKLAAALVTTDGQIVDARSVPTPNTDDADEVWGAAEALLDELMTTARRHAWVGSTPSPGSGSAPPDRSTRPLAR